MPKLFVTTNGGEEITIDAAVDHTMMEAIRDYPVRDMLALCGGCCSCSTCHVWVEPAFLDRLGAPSVDEQDLLNQSEQVRPNSRLSCQIKLSDALDGIHVTLPPPD